MSHPHRYPTTELPHLLDHATSEIPIIGSIRDGGEVYAPHYRRGEAPRLPCKYHPDDGYYALYVETGDFDPLYIAGSYLICITGSLRDACPNRPAFIKQLLEGGRFGMVDCITRDSVRLWPARASRESVNVARDQVEMVYIPIDRIGDTAVDPDNR